MSKQHTKYMYHLCAVCDENHHLYENHNPQDGTDDTVASSGEKLDRKALGAAGRTSKCTIEA